MRQEHAAGQRNGDDVTDPEIGLIHRRDDNQAAFGNVGPHRARCHGDHLMAGQRTHDPDRAKAKCRGDDDYLTQTHDSGAQPPHKGHGLFAVCSAHIVRVHAVDALE